MKLLITRPVVLTGDGGTRSFVPGLTVEVDAATAEQILAQQAASLPSLLQTPKRQLLLAAGSLLMIKLDVTADVAKATEYLSDVAAKRIPDAAAKALTRTAFDARDAVRGGLPERFNLRRPWISRGIGVTPCQAPHLDGRGLVARPLHGSAGDRWHQERQAGDPCRADGTDRPDPRHPQEPVAGPGDGEEERVLSCWCRVRAP